MHDSDIDQEIPLLPEIPTRLSADASPPEGVQNAEIAERLATLEDQLASLHRLCCEAWLGQGDVGRAVSHQEMACRLAPEASDYRYVLGYLRFLQGDRAAVEDFEAVAAAEPERAEGQFNLAMAHLSNGNFAEAEEHFAKASELDPGDAEVWTNLGVVRFQLGRVDDAMVCFEKAIEIDPSSADATSHLGDVFDM